MFSCWHPTYYTNIVRKMYHDLNTNRNPVTYIFNHTCDRGSCVLRFVIHNFWLSGYIAVNWIFGVYRRCGKCCMLQYSCRLFWRQLMLDGLIWCSCWHFFMSGYIAVNWSFLCVVAHHRDACSAMTQNTAHAAYNEITLSTSITLCYIWQNMERLIACLACPSHFYLTAICPISEYLIILCV